VDNQIDPTQFAKELEQHGVKAIFAEIDLAATGSAKQLFEQAKHALGSPTILINNACVDIEVSFVELSEDMLDRHYQVNVRATTMLCREFVKNGYSGSIINMTSGQSLSPMGEDEIPYTTTKASVEILTKQLAQELSTKDIMIAALDLGPTDTGWMSEELKEHIVKESKRKVNMPNDTAELIVRLLADKQSNGQVIHAEQ
jgi:3-oxoacyl-[acyl-carrier protein] reductase